MSMKKVQKDGVRKILDDLKKHVECPVCLEAPRDGPIYSCPNGHLVCKKCKPEVCPICREVMGNIKSLLAINIIEIILHKCKFVKCEDVFPLGEELTGHERNCKQRIVTCPDKECDKKFALCDLAGHFGKKSTCCNNAEPSVVDETTGTFKGNGDYSVTGINKLKKPKIGWFIRWCTYKDIQLALCVNKSGDYYHFYLVMFESEEVCAGYDVKLEVFNGTGVSSQLSPPRHYFQGNPISIDMPKSDIEHLGLSVHYKVMEKMVLDGDKFEFRVSFTFV